MKRITLLNLVLVFGFTLFYTIFRVTGYNTSSMFALPNVTYLFMTPLIGMAFIFNATLIILFKPEKRWQSIYKWMSLILLAIISFACFTLPWTYIALGSSLMIFIQTIIIVLTIILAGMSIFAIIKEKK